MKSKRAAPSLRLLRRPAFGGAPRNDVCVISFIICVIVLSSCSVGNVPYQETRVLLGTYVTIKIQDQDKTTIEKRESANRAFCEIERIENLLSSFKKGNSIDKINNSGIKEVLLDEETFYVLEKAKYFNEISGGAFDITVLPLLELWGFHDTEHRVPTDDKIQQTLKRVGSDKMILDKTKRSVRFLEPGMKIDLGAIAKGFAVDMAVLTLKREGIKNGVVDAGGDMRVIGRKSLREKWSIGIQDPFRRGRIIEKRPVEDEAISTSGGYENYFEGGGKRYCHIINPKTGRPVENNVLSVTIIAKDCLTADALATAVFVLGKGKGLEVVNVLDGIRAIVVCDD